ncbi:MAG: hypothetical protein ACLSD6_08355 [Clostridium sp.]
MVWRLWMRKICILKKGSLIRITSKDSEGRENETTVSMRSEESGVAL